MAERFVDDQYQSLARIHRTQADIEHTIGGAYEQYPGLTDEEVLGAVLGAAGRITERLRRDQRITAAAAPTDMTPPRASDSAGGTTMGNTRSSTNRARTRAVRARMDATGEPWSVAARRVDQAHADACPDPTSVPPADQDQRQADGHDTTGTDQTARTT